jgi:hypothetical protein
MHLRLIPTATAASSASFSPTHSASQGIGGVLVEGAGLALPQAVATVIYSINYVIVKHGVIVIVVEVNYRTRGLLSRPVTVR